VVKVLLKEHWLSVVVKTSEDWTWPIVKLFIVYYVGHFYGGVNITMSTTTSITINSRKRAPGVPEEKTVGIIALNRNSMKIMGLVIVALPEGRATIV